MKRAVSGPFIGFDCGIQINMILKKGTQRLIFLSPGDLLVHSNPIYGGTDHFVKQVLPKFGIHVLGFDPNQSQKEVEEMIVGSDYADRLKMMYVETPANPTNHLVDLEMCRVIADKFSTEERALITVDNTYMGPLWQHPLKHGAVIPLPNTLEATVM